MVAIPITNYGPRTRSSCGRASSSRVAHETSTSTNPSARETQVSMARIH